METTTKISLSFHFELNAAHVPFAKFLQKIEIFQLPYLDLERTTGVVIEVS